MIARQIDLFLEELYDSSRTRNVGERMATLNLKNSQIQGFKNLIISTSRFSEIVNFIKNQTGKDTRRQWTQIAGDLLAQLQELEEKANELGEGDAGTILDIKMRLARGWAKQIVTHYLYIRRCGEDQNNGN